MQFRLPTNLQTELLAYDPGLKALVKEQQPKRNVRKSTHPFGKPEGLIPANVVRQSLFDDAVDHINSNELQYRFHEFKQLVNVGTPQAGSVTHSILYYYENCWYAAWLPPKGQESEYVYGYAFAFKHTKQAVKTLPTRILNQTDKYLRKTFGRSEFYFYQHFVTVEDIVNGHSQRNWNIPNTSHFYDKAKALFVAIKNFETQLRTTIPVWDDSANIFDRIIATKSIAKVIAKADSDLDTEEYWNQCGGINQWQPSFNTFIDAIQYTGQFNENLLRYGNNYKRYVDIIHILNTPFFKKWIQQQCDQCIALYSDVTNTKQASIQHPWNIIHQVCKNIWQVNCIWPDCPIDYYQSHLEELIHIDTLVLTHYKTVYQWLNKHMPVASYFSILEKFYAEQEAKERREYCHSSRLGTMLYQFYDWRDIIQMLSTVLEQFPDFQPPKRWRITEFHDHVQAQAWKIKNPNESLPQDLFPAPIKVTYWGRNWTFFQPIDTHQLAQWGQAVRNCVGSASTYVEGIRKKKHFIVLCMLDSKPQFTVQLEVDMGMMSVKQIAGISNARLTDEQRDEYTKAFAIALNSREAELKSA